MSEMCQFETKFEGSVQQCICSICGQVVRTDNNCDRVYCMCGGKKRPIPPRVIPLFSETQKRDGAKKKDMVADIRREEAVRQHQATVEPHPTVRRNVVADVMRWGKEHARWVAAGKPKREDGQQRYIHDAICVPCTYYREGKCSKCGCNLRKQPLLTDKVTMATTGCPLGRWGARSRRLTCRWVVGVLTAPRKRERLTATLRAIREAGWGNIHVFAEPNAPKPEDWEKYTTWHQNEKRLGGVLNFTHALNTMLSQDKLAEAVLIFQDDIELAKGARGYVERKLLWPEPGAERVGIISMYTNTNHHKPNTVGLTLHEQGGFYGALGWIFPWHAAHAFLRVQKKKQIVRGAIDVCASRVLKNEGFSLFHHQPSLIQHVGDTSVLHPGAKISNSRKAVDNWCRDATELLK